MEERGAELRARFAEYDRRVDLVSIFQVYFELSRADDGLSLPETVRHFERFPRIPAGDVVLRPDFTVLFLDGTLLVGELANLALHPGSLDALAAQLGRYDQIAQAPSGPRDDHGHQPLAPVSAVDVLLITPTEDMNAACARLHQAMEDEGHPYAPINRPTVMGWSLDGGTGVYTLVRTSYAGNPQLRDHGRTPSLSTWLRNGHDTLRGLPRHFETVKVAARFMNDEPPEVYTATVLWAVSMPRLIADRGLPTPCDLEVDVQELVERLREETGYGDHGMIRRALEFLRVARLAEEGPAGWVIHYRDLRRVSGDTAEALILEYTSPTHRARPPRQAAEPGRAQPPQRPERLFDPETEAG